MKLDKVDNYLDFEGIVRGFKGKFPKGSVADNCYLLPDKLSALCAQGRFYQLHIQDTDSLAFLADEGDFYRLYLFAQEQAQPHLDKADKPILAEVLYPEGRISPPTKRLLLLLERDGFFLHKTNRQYQLAIPPLPMLEEKLNPMLERCKQYGLTVSNARLADFEQICALWAKLIDRYAFVYTSQEQWLQEIQAGRIQCILNSEGHVVAAQQYSLEKKRSLESHIVVTKSQQGKGLATVLLYRWLFCASQAGCANAFCWIAEDNLASVHLHRDFVASNKLSAQYVRES